ncbi:ABC transporter permease [Streptomyces sp. NPDC058622]|uniref:ABC transporter permease n=1 Tax=unclassified Streptomyces TaxID=2593676 RepID=UPI0036629834
MKVLWIEFRRSPLLLVLPLLVAVDLASIFGRSRWWIGVWPQASAAAQIPALFFAPIAAAATVWAVGRSLRRGVAEQRETAARAGWRIEAAQFTATLAHVLIAYVLGAAAAAAVTVPEGGPGFLWPGYLLLGASTIVACTAIGHAVGRLSTSVIAAPVICGLACFVAIGALGSPDQLGFYVLSGSPARKLSESALLSHLALALFLAAFAVLGPSVFRRKSGLRTAAAPARAAGLAAITAVFASLVALVSAGPVQVDRENTGTPLCSSGAPRVCLWPEDRTYLPEVTAMVKRLDAIPQDWIKMPQTFHEAGLRPWSEASANDFEIIEGNLWFVSPNLAGAIMRDSIPMRCEQWREDSLERLSAATFEIQTWLEFRANGPNERKGIHGGPPGVDFAAIEKISKEGEPAQKAWVDQRLNVIEETPCA